MAVSIPMNLVEIRVDVGPLRKNSTGSSNIKDSEGEVLPNYLRASTGSCHDICKYGKKRGLTMMTRISVLEKLPLSPNKSRESDKRNNLQNKNSLFCTSRSPSTVRSSIRQVREKEIQPGAKKVVAAAKSPHKWKMKPLETKAASSDGWNNGINTSKQTRTSKESKKFILGPATGSLSHKMEVRKVRKEASHLKNKERITKAEIEPASVEDIPEKILFITELNSENQEVGLTQEENISDDSVESQKQIQASSPSLLQENEDSGYVDKEIDLVQFSPSSSPKENIGSRSHEGGYSSKSSSSSLVSLLSSSSAAEADCSPRMRTRDVYSGSDGIENESTKVVLRHQNVEQRSAEGLFNDVIEETARKLAKTRKSKVKALVGAFETVISLQDLSLLEQLRSHDLPRSP